MQTIYNRLNYTIQKFENTINNNMDKVIGTVKIINKNPLVTCKLIILHNS